MSYNRSDRTGLVHTLVARSRVSGWGEVLFADIASRCGAGSGGGMMGEEGRSVLIADDLTGACDAAAGLALPGDPLPVVLAGAEDIRLLEDFRSRPSSHGWMAFDTESRGLPAAAAASRVGWLCRSVALELASSHRPLRLLFKKIDSTLRGNFGAELAAVMQTFPERVAVVAPAFPAAGRTTVAGRCLVWGVPVEATEFARDPTAPVRGSRIADLLEGAGPISQCGPSELRRRAADADAGSVIVVDAETDDDLRAVAAATGHGPARYVLVGSAGLARALARRPASGEGAQPPVSAGQGRDGSPRPVLGLVGSMSGRSRTQARILADRGDVVCRYIDPGDPAALRDVPSMLAARRSVLVLSPEARADADNRMPDLATRLALSFGETARAALSAAPEVAFFLTGGDTAVAAIRALGAREIGVRGEFRPGIPVVGFRAAMGRPGHEVDAVVKAGGFGSDEVMLEAFAYLGEGRCLR